MTPVRQVAPAPVRVGPDPSGRGRMREAVPADTVHSATRMCIGCRGREIRSELLRVVLVDGEGGRVLTLDERRALPGRGAWVHARIDCIDQAVRRKAFGRALRATVFLDPSGIREQIVARVQEQQDTDAIHTVASADENRKRV